MKNLFMVELGEPDGGERYSSTFFSSGSKIKPSYLVLANSYDEAAGKVLNFVSLIKETKSIFGEHGSLDIDDDKEIKVKKVTLMTDELIY